MSTAANKTSAQQALASLLDALAECRGAAIYDTRGNPRLPAYAWQDLYAAAKVAQQAGQ